MGKQLDFGMLDPAFRDTPGEYEREAERVLDCAREVVRYHGMVWAEQALGRPRRVIQQALKENPRERNGHNLYLSHAIILVRRAPTDDLANVITSAREPEFDPEEQLIALTETAFEMLGKDVNRMLHAKTHQRLLATRRKAAK